MYGYYGYSFSYLIYFLPVLILTIYAQSKVSSSFQKYSRVPNRRGYTGADVARQILNVSGIYDVQIEPVRGNLTDHYDPNKKVLRLSDSVYHSSSLAALAVAAHECGHAIQDEEGYAFLRLRSAMVPITNFSSRLAMPMILIGILMVSISNYGFGYNFALFGILLFGVAVLFSLVTLPVEFNASKRAIEVLEENQFLASDEIGPAKKVLSAAALTYVAAAAVALANLLRWLSILGRRRD